MKIQNDKKGFARSRMIGLRFFFGLTFGVFQAKSDLFTNEGNCGATILDQES